MIAQEWEELRAYREKLRSYSTEELEDIYFNIHILRQPLRYKVLMMELERRRLQPLDLSPTPQVIDLREWLEAQPCLMHHALAKAAILSVLIFVLTTLATFGMLTPIWLFAIPLRFIGLQTALVYFACAPVPPILGAAVGGKLGGRGIYGIWVLLGVAAALWLFNATGAPDAIIRSVMQHQGTGGPQFSGF